MASKKETGVIVAASLLTTAGLWHLTRQAKSTAEGFRDDAARELKKQINYEWLIEEDFLALLKKEFPRTKRWHNVDYLVEKVLADPTSPWIVNPYREPSKFPKDVCQVDERRTIVEGVYFQKQYIDSGVASKLGGIFAKTELYVVGERQLFTPPKFHPSNESGFSYNKY